jgi:hypothetical protein
MACSGTALNWWGLPCHYKDSITANSFSWDYFVHIVWVFILVPHLCTWQLCAPSAPQWSYLSLTDLVKQTQDRKRKKLRQLCCAHIYSTSWHACTHTSLKCMFVMEKDCMYFVKFPDTQNYMVLLHDILLRNKQEAFQFCIPHWSQCFSTAIASVRSSTDIVLHSCVFLLRLVRYIKFQISVSWASNVA